MGQKVSPNGLRVGINKGWDSLWFSNKKDIAKNIKEDNTIRTFIKKKYFACAISKILIERSAKRVTISVYTARPGILIGQKGAGVEAMNSSEGLFIPNGPNAHSIIRVSFNPSGIIDLLNCKSYNFKIQSTITFDYWEDQDGIEHFKEEFRKFSGIQFDPELTKVFLDILENDLTMFEVLL